MRLLKQRKSGFLRRKAIYLNIKPLPFKSVKYCHFSTMKKESSVKMEKMKRNDFDWKGDKEIHQNLEYMENEELLFTKKLKIMPKIAIAAKEMGILIPTQIQEKAIPKILRHQNVVASAETGTGKTAAFAMPILHSLHVQLVSELRKKEGKEGKEEKKEKKEGFKFKPKVLVIVPTRTLSSQIAQHFVSLSKYLGNLSPPLPPLHPKEKEKGGEEKRGGEEGRGEEEKRGLYDKIHVVNACERRELKEGEEGRERSEVLVSTPKTLLNLLEEGKVETSQVGVLVVDECDKLLSFGMVEQVLSIWEKLPRPKKNRKQELHSKTKEKVMQTLLFSATLPSHVEELVRRLSPSASVVELNKEMKVPSSILHFYYSSLSRQKYSLLLYLLKRKGKLNLSSRKVVVFVRTIQRALSLHQRLLLQGFEGVFLVHSLLSPSLLRTSLHNFNHDLPPPLYPSPSPPTPSTSPPPTPPHLKEEEEEREEGEKKEKRVKKRRVRLLISTDMVGRGMDMEGVEVVVNYDFPETVEGYVHRSGRTGRGKKEGTVISFVSSDIQLLSLSNQLVERNEKYYLFKIQQHLGSKVIQNRKIPGPWNSPQQGNTEKGERRGEEESVVERRREESVLEGLTNEQRRKLELRKRELREKREKVVRHLILQNKLKNKKPDFPFTPISNLDNQVIEEQNSLASSTQSAPSTSSLYQKIVSKVWKEKLEKKPKAIKLPSQADEMEGAHVTPLGRFWSGRYENVVAKMKERVARRSGKLEIDKKGNVKGIVRTRESLIHNQTKPQERREGEKREGDSLFKPKNNQQTPKKDKFGRAQKKSEGNLSNLKNVEEKNRTIPLTFATPTTKSQKPKSDFKIKKQ